MNKKALAKKYNDTRERKETRQLLWRWGRVQEFCKQTNSEIRYFQDRASEIAQLRARAEVKVDGGRTSDPTARAAEDLEALQIQYETCVSQGATSVKREIAYKSAVDDIIQSELSPDDRELLQMRYKMGWPWLMVASKLCIDESYARERDRRMVDKIAKKMTIIQKSPV